MQLLKREYRGVQLSFEPRPTNNVCLVLRKRTYYYQDLDLKQDALDSKSWRWVPEQRKMPKKPHPVAVARLGQRKKLRLSCQQTHGCQQSLQEESKHLLRWDLHHVM